MVPSVQHSNPIDFKISDSRRERLYEFSKNFAYECNMIRRYNGPISLTWQPHRLQNLRIIGGKGCMSLQRNFAYEYNMIRRYNGPISSSNPIDFKISDSRRERLYESSKNFGYECNMIRRHNVPISLRWQPHRLQNLRIIGGKGCMSL